MRALSGERLRVFWKLIYRHGYRLQRLRESLKTKVGKRREDRFRDKLRLRLANPTWGEREISDLNR